MKRYIILFFSIITFILSSCSGLFEDRILQEDTASLSTLKTDSKDIETERYCTVYGDVEMTGAYPSEIFSSNSERNDLRTAFPEQPLLKDYVINVKAVNVSDETDYENGEIISGTSNSRYDIQIPVGPTVKTYEIIITAKTGENEFFYGKSTKFSISRDNISRVRVSNSIGTESI